MKHVLVDFSHLNDLNGFGEIARNYAPRLAKTELPGVRYIFVVPDDKVGAFGDHITYIRRNHKREDLKRLEAHIDLWHATDQQYHMRGGDKTTIQLLTVHDLNFLREKSGVHKWRHIVQLGWRMRRSDYLTCISRYVRQDIIDHYHLHQVPLDVIYNGIGALECGEQQQPAFIDDENELFFLAIGQVREKKNFQMLVPMMRYLPGYRLYICGDDHFAYAQQLRQQIEREGEGRVVLTGKITDKEKHWLYAHAQALLFPSRLEGFGIPVLEAMRFHCKVFSSRLSSLPEVCNIHATYWDHFEPSYMADVVRQGVEAWQKDGEAARQAEKYSKQFNYENYTEQYTELYMKLLAKGM